MAEIGFEGENYNEVLRQRRLRSKTCDDADELLGSIIPSAGTTCKQLSPRRRRFYTGKLLGYTRNKENTFLIKKI
jgi:hypothetical protein